MTFLQRYFEQRLRSLEERTDFWRRVVAFHFYLYFYLFLMTFAGAILVYVLPQAVYFFFLVFIAEAIMLVFVVIPYIVYSAAMVVLEVEKGGQTYRIPAIDLAPVESLSYAIGGLLGILIGIALWVILTSRLYIVLLENSGAYLFADWLNKFGISFLLILSLLGTVGLLIAKYCDLNLDNINHRIQDPNDPIARKVDALVVMDLL